MYKRLTKLVTIDGKECIGCAQYGTELCHVHNETATDCLHCEIMAAMLNQLYQFEELVCRSEESKLNDIN